MKSNSGASKRFKVTGSGKLKRKSAFMRHILTKKATKRKRALGNAPLVHVADEARIKRLILE